MHMKQVNKKLNYNTALTIGYVLYSVGPSRGSTIVLVGLMLTHLTLNVYELGKHQRPIESQLSYIVVVLSRTERLQEGVKQKHH